MKLLPFRRRVRVQFRQAVVSFCPDLTSPNAPQLPVAVLLVATSEDWIMAAVAAADVSAPHPATAEILMDVPALLRRHVERAFSSAGDRPSIDAVLNRLHDSLRSSLHVSRTTGLHTATITQQEINSVLIREVTELLQHELAGVRDGLEPTATPTHRKPQKPMGGGRPPETAAWPLSGVPA